MWSQSFPPQANVAFLLLRVSCLGLRADPSSPSFIPRMSASKSVLVWVTCFAVQGHTSLKEHPCVPCIILVGRLLCKVTPAVPTWGLSPEVSGVGFRVQGLGLRNQSSGIRVYGLGFRF